MRELLGKYCIDLSKLVFGGATLGNNERGYVADFDCVDRRKRSIYSGAFRFFVT
jgi:hypothetical protein